MNVWLTIPVRVPQDAEAVIIAALARFYQGQRRPMTNPVALGWMLENLCADFLAGPSESHSAAGDWRLR